MTKAPRLWFLGLAAFFAALISSPALASGSASLSGSVAAARPLPAASWHGRPIRHPQPAPGAAAVAAWSGGGVRPALRIGAGYGRPHGLAAVRRVQRLLHRIGYHSGPVDGLFGPRTRASVQWFQIKHGLRPTGLAGSATVALLRLRAAGAELSTRAGPPPPARVLPVAGPARPAPRPGATRRGPLLPAALAVAGALALLAGTVLMWRRERPAGATDAPTRPLLPPRTAMPDGAPRAVGYATGRDPAECRRGADAIERACVERGWAVARIVREGQPGHAGDNGRPGLAFALEQLGEEGAGSRLVASRLEDVGRTRRDLASVLAWCAKSQVDLIALDVGLDTATSHGKLAARCLVAAGDGAGHRPRRSNGAQPSARHAVAR